MVMFPSFFEPQVKLLYRIICIFEERILFAENGHFIIDGTEVKKAAS